jgi:predicted secreted protein
MGRFAYVAHCLLNANAKVDEWAPCAGASAPLLALLRERGFALRQLPCPELAFAGFNRFWAVREQYDTPAYRRHCAALAEPVAALMVHDLRDGGEVVLVGVDGSPSLGVHLTCSGPEWGGRPDQPGDFDSDVVAGAGLFVEALLDALAARGLPPVRAHGLGYDLPDFDEAAALAELGRELAP